MKKLLVGFGAVLVVAGIVCAAYATITINNTAAGYINVGKTFSRRTYTATGYLTSVSTSITLDSAYGDGAGGADHDIRAKVWDVSVFPAVLVDTEDELNIDAGQSRAFDWLSKNTDEWNDAQEVAIEFGEVVCGGFNSFGYYHYVGSWGTSAPTVLDLSDVSFGVCQPSIHPLDSFALPDNSKLYVSFFAAIPDNAFDSDLYLIVQYQKYGDATWYDVGGQYEGRLPENSDCWFRACETVAGLADYVSHDEYNMPIRWTYGQYTPGWTQSTWRYSSVPIHVNLTW